MERKRANFERWKRFGGGVCGVDEAIIKGGKTIEGEEEEVPTKGMEAVNLEDEKEVTTSNGNGLASEEGTERESSAPTAATTTTGIDKANTPGLDDKFVDAPIAPKEAVEKAVPALTA